MYFHSVLSTLIHNLRFFEGLSDDDLRESAYELLLASMFFSGYCPSLHDCVLSVLVLVHVLVVFVSCIFTFLHTLASPMLDIL